MLHHDIVGTWEPCESSGMERYHCVENFIEKFLEFEIIEEKFGNRVIPMIQLKDNPAIKDYLKRACQQVQYMSYDDIMRFSNHLLQLKSNLPMRNTKEQSDFLIIAVKYLSHSVENSPKI